MTFMTVWIGGIGWDALFHVNAMTMFSSIQIDESLDDVRAVVPEQDVALGLGLFYVAKALAFLSATSSNLLPALPETYFIYGMASASIAVLSAIVVSLVVSSVTRTRVAGLLTLALLFSTPLWVGMAGIAYRDAPIANGLTLVAAGLTLLFAETQGDRFPWISSFLVGLGTFLAVASRAGAVALVVALVSTSLTPLLWRRVRQERRILTGVVGIVFGAFLGLVVAILINPVARLNPLDWLVESVLLSQSNPTTMLVKVLSRDVMSDDLPFWYIPTYLGAQLPVATLALLVVSLIVLCLAALQQAKVPRDANSKNSKPPLLTSWPFVVQGFVLPLFVIAVGSNIYDGLRHVLFIIPPLMVLIAMASIFAPTKLWSMTVSVLAALAVFLGSWATMRWFPYSYAHVNVVAGLVKEPRIWELDYWGLTAREGVRELQSLGAAIVFVSPTANTSLPWGSSEPETDTVNQSNGQYGWYVFERWAVDLPPECGLVLTVERDGHTLGRGGLCEATGVD